MERILQMISTNKYIVRDNDRERENKREREEK